MRNGTIRWQRIQLPGVCPVTFRSSQACREEVPAIGVGLRGGATPQNPWRSLPNAYSVDIAAPSQDFLALRIRGVFGIFAEMAPDEPGGLTVRFFKDSQLLETHQLLLRRHYLCSTELSGSLTHQGDGVSLQSAGTIQLDGADHRMDDLLIERLKPDSASRIEISSEPGASAFVICQVEVGQAAMPGCPFHSESGGVALSELASVIRNRDRVQLRKAMDQLRSGLEATHDLDEARGQALTFLAVTTAATLELGGARDMHKVQLEVARKLDQLDDLRSIAEEAEAAVRRVVGELLATETDPTKQWIDKALSWIDRHYAQDFSDADVARMVGLSRSHFRFLFQEVTGQPFHRFVVAKRLEKAHILIVEQGASVSEAATATGFGSTSHFSRAFTKRFHINPNQLRKSAL